MTTTTHRLPHPVRSEGGAECQRILEAAKDSERLPVAKTEDKGWPGMSVMV